MATFDENGNYVKTTWKGGDKITAAKLNKIEESLEAINNNDISRHVEADARLDALESGTASDKQAMNAKVVALEDVVEANKDAADLELYSINQHMTLLDKKIDDGVAEVEAIANTVDGKISQAETNMQNQVNQGKADMEAMVAEVEGELDGINTQLEHIVNIDVKKFGAEGDGITDDTLAIQNAINSINAGNIFFPKGEYIISECLIENKTNFSLSGQEAKIKLKNNVNNKKMITFYNCENIKVYNIEFNGNKENQTVVTTSDGIHGKDVTENCPIILLENVKKADIYNCEFVDSQGDGIQLDVIYLNQTNTNNRECEDIRIRDNIFYGNGRNGVSVVHANRVNILNNKFNDIELFSTSIACAVDIEPNPYHNFITKNIIIENNTINNCVWGLLVCNSGTDNAIMNNILIRNNNINNCSTGCQTLNLNHNLNNSDFIIDSNIIDKCGYGISLDDTDNIEVTNNVILNSIALNDYRGTAIGVNVYGETNNLISNNILLSNNTIQNAEKNGISLKNVITCKVLNNIVNNAGFNTDTSSIMLSGNIENLSIVSNNINSKNNFTILAAGINDSLTNLEIYSNNLIGKNITLSPSSQENINIKNNIINGEINNFVINNSESIRNKLMPSSLILPNSDSLNAGGIAFSSTFSSLNVQDGFGIKKVVLFRSGPTSERPNGTKRLGELYFDTTLNKYIVWNNGWYDMNGTPVN